jgi:hypothetical protein
MFGFTKRSNGLKQTTLPPDKAILRPERSSPRSSKAALGLAAALTTAIVVAVVGFGQLGYAATSVTHAVQTAAHVVVPARSAVAPLSSAAAQYGEKVNICAVEPNGKQHTISISKKAEAAYLAEHPNAFAGSCGEFRPHGVTANVCITISSTHHVTVFVPAGRLAAYLKRNPGSYKTNTGKCSRG